MRANPQLRHLYLSENQLTTLSDSILDLPSSCTVDAERNRFSADYVRTFQQRLEQRRRETLSLRGPTVHQSIDDVHPPTHAQTLEERLRAWSDEFETAFPRPMSGSDRPAIGDANFSERFHPLLILAPDEREILNNYLGRLREVNDYRAGGDARRNIVLRVDRMLQLACRNEEFKGEMLALIATGLETCGDRVLIIFNDIEIKWQLYQEGLSDDTLQALAIRAQRYEEVKKQAIAVAERLHLGDQIETILYCHIRLRDPLELPITTQGMLYPAMAGVDQDELDLMHARILSIPDRDLLAASDFWQARIQKNNRGFVERINEKYVNMLENAEEYFILDEKERVEFLKKPEHQELAAILRELRARDPDHYNYPRVADEIQLRRNLQIFAEAGRRQRPS